MAEPDNAAGASPSLLYVADPMCSWCYGFSPVITGLAERLSTTGVDGPGREIRLLMGGLRAGNRRPMRQTDKDYLRGAWTRVGAATGLPFDYRFFDRDGFVYDTEPACRAVVAMREQAPDLALAYLVRISRAFYAEGRDTTSPEVLAELASELGVDRREFARLLLDPGLKEAVMRDFVAAGEAGIQGFPTLLAMQPDGLYQLVTSGYRPLDAILPMVEAWVPGAQKTRGAAPSTPAKA